MKKVLVYQNDEAIAAHEKFAKDLVICLNALLEKFRKEYNYFHCTIDQNFSFDLVSDPIKLFDSLLRANSPIKPIGGQQIDIKELAKLVGINRDMFISDFTVTLPGSVNEYNRYGTKALFRLEPRYKNLITWDTDKFVLNEKQLNENFDFFRTFAETPEQVEMYEYWENLCNMMNTHLEKGFVKEYEVHSIAGRIGLIEKSQVITVGNFKKWFGIDYKKLAADIKNLSQN
jgi:hypothetical protein